MLRRILRRAVRHAWLLGRLEPTLVLVVERVIEMRRDQFPELASRRKHILETTRAEEERFLATVEGGADVFADGGRERIAATIPNGRVATPADVAWAAVALCAPGARHLVGEVVNVNGGAVLPG